MKKIFFAGLALISAGYAAYLLLRLLSEIVVLVTERSQITSSDINQTLLLSVILLLLVGLFTWCLNMSKDSPSVISAKFITDLVNKLTDRSLLEDAEYRKTITICISALVVMFMLSTASLPFGVKEVLHQINIRKHPKTIVELKHEETQQIVAGHNANVRIAEAKNGTPDRLQSPEIRQLQPTTGTVTTNNQKVFERTIPPDYLLSVVGKGLRVIKDDAVEKNYIPYDKKKCWPQGWVEYSVPVTSHVWYVACTPT